MSIILIMVHVMTSFVIVIVSVLFVITDKHTNKQTIVLPGINIKMPSSLV